jgi:hypothetical protein
MAEAADRYSKTDAPGEYWNLPLTEMDSDSASRTSANVHSHRIDYVSLSRNLHIKSAPSFSLVPGTLILLRFEIGTPYRTWCHYTAECNFKLDDLTCSISSSTF